ncbi:MAG: lactonase family protein [Clostridia bacterium]|nr:lactonase family protein [Clostridia bacterium]
MADDRYVAYVATYTQDNDKGIQIYDVDVEKGRMEARDSVTITNSSYFTISHHLKYLYAITDLGVEAFKIEADGGLSPINRGMINGMRGCYISTDYSNQFIFVAGYHDGKITVLRIREDGGVGEITDEVFHKGMGSISERNFRPHVSCVKMTRDNKFLCAADLGLDHVKIYKFDEKNGKIKLIDVVRCELESAPKYIKFRKDGKFAYIIHELKNIIDVYSYEIENDLPVFTKIQTVSTLNTYHAGGSAACAMKFSIDNKYLFCSNAGDNSVGLFSINKATGLLTKQFVLPISGDYPKDIAVFPDTRHLVSLNHESDTATFFHVDVDKKTLVMNGRELRVNKGNCIVILKIEK